MTHQVFQRIIDGAALSDDERSMLTVLRDLVANRIAGRAELHDQNADFPWDNIHDLMELDLNLAFLPVDAGGLDVSYTCFLLLVEELAIGCPATAVTWATTYHALAPLLEFGTSDQKARLLPTIARGGLAALAITEASGGSDATAMSTKFTTDGNQIRIDGEKIFITNGDVADVYLVFGKWSQPDSSPASMSALLVERDAPGLEVGPRLAKLGHRASSTVPLHFDGCVVPADNLLLGPGDGRRILLSALNRSRPSIAAHALGIARASFDEAVTYANQRQQFNTDLLGFQGIQFMIADMATQLAMTQAWLFHVADLVERGHQVATEASMLKLAASDLAMTIATNSLQLHGGYGYCSGNRSERLFRDAKLTQIWEGTNEIQRQTIGRAFWER